MDEEQSRKLGISTPTPIMDYLSENSAEITSVLSHRRSGGNDEVFMDKYLINCRAIGIKKKRLIA